MRVLKPLLYLLPAGIFNVLVFANSTNLNSYQIFNSKNYRERIETLQNLQENTDASLYQRLIIIALLDEVPAVRIEAQRILYNSQPINTDQEKLLKQLSSEFSYEKIKALNFFKNTTNIHPIIRYTLLWEIVFKTTNPEIQLKIARIATFDSILQQELLQIATSDKVPQTVQTTAEYILIRTRFLDLEVQKEILQIIINADKISYTVQTAIRNILRIHSIHLDIQKELIRIATSDTISDIVRTLAEDSLIRFHSLHLEVQQELLRILISDIVSDTARETAKNIIINTQNRVKPLSLHPEIQQVLARIASDDKVSDIARETARNIIITTQQKIRSFPLYPEIQKELLRILISDRISDNTQERAKNIIMEINFLHLTSQKELLQIATSNTLTKKIKTIAQDILIHRKQLDPEIKKNMGLVLKCQRAFRNFKF